MWVMALIVTGVGIVQLPFLADLFGGTRWTSTLTSRALVTLVAALCAAALAIFAFVFLPVAMRLDAPLQTHADAQSMLSPKVVLYILAAVLFWPNTVYNYAAAVLVKPGLIPRPVAQDGLQTHRKHSSAAAIAQTDDAFKRASAVSQDCQDPNQARFCSKCQAPKPEDAHHCRACGRCVLFMDHHCPFTFNCVGKENFTYFYMFLAHVSAGLVLAISMTATPFYRCWIIFDAPMFCPLAQRTAGEFDVCAELGDLSLMFAPAVALFAATSCLLAFHTFLLATDWSTLEFLQFLDKPSPRLLLARLQALPWRKPTSRVAVLMLAVRPRAWHYFVPFSEARAAKA